MNFFVPEPERIVVVRALQLGDMLCAVPALRALRAACPHARISLVGLPWAREFVRRFPRYVDEFIEFPGFPGLPEQGWRPDAVVRFLQDIQDRHFDAALQLHGDGRLLNSIVALMDARRAAGYCLAGAYHPHGELFAWREDEHEIGRWVRLLEELGAPKCGLELEFPILCEDEREASLLARQWGEEVPYVCIHPGAQLASRRWPAPRFARVADELAAQGYAIVVTGTQGEAPITARVAGSMHAKAVDLAGRTSLGTVGAIIRNAELVVCNDTGVSHIAAALGTPSVVVSCGSDPARWAPLDRRRHRVLYQPIACRPCSHAVCPIGHPCAEAIEARAVIEAARTLIADIQKTDLYACAL